MTDTYVTGTDMLFSEAERGDEYLDRKASSRVTVRLSGELGAAISELEEITVASNPSEVVRRAILVYHTLVKQKISGNDPVIEVIEGGKTKKIPIFL